MIHQVRIWIEDDIVKCCSGVCTEESCPRVGICKETYIVEVSDKPDEIVDNNDDDSFMDDYYDTSYDSLPCGCCACCGCSCHDDERED